jgi:hypothetical protein
MLKVARETSGKDQQTTSNAPRLIMNGAEHLKWTSKGFNNPILNTDKFNVNIN